MVTHTNVRLEQITSDPSYPRTDETKDICDTCYNEYKTIITDGAKCSDVAEKLLDGKIKTEGEHKGINHDYDNDGSSSTG
jgi:hypothetical protein